MTLGLIFAISSSLSALIPATNVDCIRGVVPPVAVAVVVVEVRVGDEGICCIIAEADVARGEIACTEYCDGDSCVVFIMDVVIPTDEGVAYSDNGDSCCCCCCCCWWWWW